RRPRARPPRPLRRGRPRRPGRDQPAGTRTARGAPGRNPREYARGARGAPRHRADRAGPRLRDPRSPDREAAAAPRRMSPATRLRLLPWALLFVVMVTGI